MSSGEYRQVYVKCPFYRFSTPTTLSCEGLGDAQTIKWTFIKKAELNKQMEVFCMDHCENCELYRMLLEAKYNDV